MNDTIRGEIIGTIIAIMRMEAQATGRNFDEGDMFFALAFKNDKELLKIKRLCGA